MVKKELFILLVLANFLWLLFHVPGTFHFPYFSLYTYAGEQPDYSKGAQEINAKDVNFFLGWKVLARFPGKQFKYSTQSHPQKDE